MTARKLNKSQRRGFARVLYHAFFVLANISAATRFDRWFLEALTDDERAELDKLNKMSRKLSERYRSLAWRLEGYDERVGPPKRGKMR